MKKLKKIGLFALPLVAATSIIAPIVTSCSNKEEQRPIVNVESDQKAQMLKDCIQLLKDDPNNNNFYQKQGFK